MRFTVAVRQEGSWYVAQCLEVDVASQGRSEQEAVDNLREAVELYLEDEPSPTITATTVTHVDVKLAG